MPGLAGARPEERLRITKQQLAEAISRLPQDQQFVLGCRYSEDLRHGEIAEVMGLSESRISQLHSLALVNLRGVIGGTAGRGEELRAAAHG